MGWSCGRQDVALGVVDELVDGFGASVAWQKLAFQLLLDQLLFSIWVETREDFLVLDEVHAVVLGLLHHSEGFVSAQV